MSLFGIYNAPVTVSDFLWDLIILIVGLFIVKYCMIFIVSLFKEIMRIGQRLQPLPMLLFGGYMVFFIILIIVVLILWAYSLTFRLFIDNPFIFFRYLPSDILKYILKYKNIPKKPFINVYVGLFGQGKTLSAVHDVIDFYHAYNDKTVFDDRIGEYVIQKVFVLSNVDINGIPYRKFTSLQQIVNIARWRHITDKKKKLRTITIVLGDEFSVQMNSRNFAGGRSSSGKVIEKNISPLFLNALLTSRHALIHGFYLTSQRFGHMDALLRQVSSYVIECRKVWRIQKQVVYDAWEYEQAARPSDCRRLEIRGFFVKDSDYKSYDTLQVVANLSKATDEGDMIPDKEIRDRIQKNVVTIADKNKKKKKFV